MSTSLSKPVDNLSKVFHIIDAYTVNLSLIIGKLKMKS